MTTETVETAVPADKPAYLTDAEVADLFEQQVAGPVTESLRLLYGAKAVTEKILLRRDFVVTQLTKQAEACERDAAGYERKAATRDPKARGRAEDDLREAETYRLKAARYRTALERL